MATAAGAVPALFLLLAVLVLPPAIFVMVAWWKLGHARARRERLTAHGLALGIAVASLAFNLVVVGRTIPGLISGDIRLGPWHLAALGVAWLSFWGALVLWLWVGRRRRNRLY